ncbi:MAG: HEAT repeat domain-containing protein [Planctomycetota bacterium]|jgi:hypothetical protein|nr:HEAT repeat domain-containing protein [Planctomycetota bacterium]
MLTALVTLLAAGLEAPVPGAARAEIVWRSDHALVMERARAEGRVVFVAVDCDDEARCERFVKEVYSDRGVCSLAERTLNLVGSGELHRKGNGECPRLGSVSCRDHLRALAALRESHLGVNDIGTVAAPQHLWLGPTGDVLLCAPFELTVEEVAWCFVTALRKADPKLELEMPEDARAPKRLLFGRAFTSQGGDVLGRGLTADELEVELKRLKASLLGGGRIGAMGKILFTDDDEAVDYAQLEFGRSLMTWSGGDFLRRSLHSVGLLSPERFWVVPAEFADDDDPRVRAEAAVALEQLAAPRSYKVVKRALGKEKDPTVERAWLRALGAVGSGESGARKILLKAAGSEDDGVLRRNAILALGHLGSHEDVFERLTATLAEGGDADTRAAAACAMALSRDPAYLAPLSAAVEKEEGDIARALEVLRGADLRRIEATVRRVGRDDLRRERVFFGFEAPAAEDSAEDSGED